MSTETRPASNRPEIRPRTVWIVGLNVLAIMLVVLVLYRARTVISWMLVAFFIALALDPLVAWLQRRLLRWRWVSVLTVLVGAGGLVTLLGATLYPVFAAQGEALIASAPGALERLRTHPSVLWADESFGIIRRAKEELASNAGVAAGSVYRLLGGIFSGVVAMISVVSLTVFMLLFGPQVLRAALEWIEPPKRRRYEELADRIHRSVGGYVGGTLLISCGGGVFTAISTAVLGIPYNLPLGFMMAILGVVPYLGSAIGLVVIVGVALVSKGVTTGIIALVVFLAYQQLEGEIIHPVVQRRTIKMNPLLITLVMLLGTSLAGILGALLALPVAGALQIVLQDVLARRKSSWNTLGDTA